VKKNNSTSIAIIRNDLKMEYFEKYSWPILIEICLHSYRKSDNSTNIGLHGCEAGALVLELCLQPTNMEPDASAC
jgi:hypothetical protein